LDFGPILRYIDGMKTQTIEVDTDTATALKQRAEEQGITVSQLVAELTTLATDPVAGDRDEITELDCRWEAFKAQDSVASSEDVVRWLQTWGKPGFRSWRNR
jgi:hypothetical protein